ncbi:MAG TPA: cytochrome c oxidase assembly protein [Terriglobales bacterium]|nr:cytochrome c oxidase assembly protein [Terriglobales bacterium]
MSDSAQGRKRRGLKYAIIGAAMVGFAFINVPLFRVFCTHFGIYVPPDERLAASTGPANTHRDVNVLFSSVLAKGLDVSFTPVHAMQTVHPGQRAENGYTFTNNSDHTVHFRAIHDIYPYQAANHLSLIQCFCYTNQTMAPHTTKTLPVIYQINTGLDPLVSRVSMMYTLEPLAPAAPGTAPAAASQGGQ